jgi:hypothetical protein
VDNESKIEEKPISSEEKQNKKANYKNGNMTPFTRRMIVFSLGALAFWSIVGEVTLVVMGFETSEALLSIASVATGALAGGLLPGE